MFGWEVVVTTLTTPYTACNTIRTGLMKYESHSLINIPFVTSAALAWRIEGVR
jgi:hypothetical protein